jgi:hypothetical protein
VLVQKVLWRYQNRNISLKQARKHVQSCLLLEKETKIKKIKKNILAGPDLRKQRAYVLTCLFRHKKCSGAIKNAIFEQAR